MKGARHQLILLGFICQAFSWDDYVLPLLSVLLWVLCLTIPKKPISIGQFGELALLGGGIGAGYFLGAATDRSTHFSFGYGLTLLQAIRLLRPLNRREKVFSVFIACFQLGVACTVVLDYRFILIFLATLVLIPRTLIEMESETFAVQKNINRSFLPLPAFAAIAIATIVFYLVFPRGSLGIGVQAPRMPGSEGTLTDSVMDPARSGSALSDRVLLQIQGQNLGYLRCFALVDFDGEKWFPDNGTFLQPVGTTAPAAETMAEPRRVRVKDANYLGKILPTDGQVLGVSGKFFRNPARNQHGMIQCQVMWNTANNVYEYWNDPKPRYRDLSAREMKRFVRFPEQTVRLTSWLDTSLDGIANPYDQALWLQRFFHQNFAYKIGGPELSRLNTADDFIFNQRQGHCERFATHMALLLRMKGIPSRVVVGYLPNSRSLFSDWYNVRFKDGHAWTEAWFKDKGWVQFDATPAATTDRSGNRFRELMDTLDFVWYSNVVAFDAPTQSRLLSAAVQSLGTFSHWLMQHRAVVLGLIFFCLLLFLWKKYGWLLQLKRNPAKAHRKMQIMAEHFYGQMLDALQRQGLDRAPQQTPFEFVQELKKRPLPLMGDIELITDMFCATRYGSNPLSAGRVLEVEKALQRIRKSRS